MKLLLGIVIAVLTTIIIASDRPSVALEPMDWSASTFVSDPFYQVATSKDLLVYSEYSYVDVTNAKRASSLQLVTAIRRRNAEGVYVPVGNFTEYTSLASTNGKWVALFAEVTLLFSVDNNNTISEYSLIPTYGGYLLSDDTFVGFDPISPNNDGNFTIRTYQYQSSNNTWNSIPGTELIVPTEFYYVGDYAAYRATDTHLVFASQANASSIQIYSRQADKSWTWVESVSVNSSYAPSINVNYNGIDTLVLSNFSASTSSSESGIAFIYTKINGQWTEQTFTTSSVQYSPEGYFGAVTKFIDANTLLVTAGRENSDGTSLFNNVGRVLVMTRDNNGLWKPSIDLNNPVHAGVWGMAVGVNDYDVVIPLLVIPDKPGPTTLTFYTVPRCFASPINVTCHDQQVNDCSKVDTTALFTINNAQCGAVSSTLNGLSLVNNKALQAQFTFTKIGGLVASCNATITCPAPPVVVAQTPSKVSSTTALEVGFVALFLAASMLVKISLNKLN